MRLWMLGFAGLVALPLTRPGYLAQESVAFTQAIAVATAPFASAAPASWLPDDPADSLYRAGRDALNRAQYRRAAELFAMIGQRYPKSGYVADALYWEAFSLYRAGGADNLRTARSRLRDQRQRYPRAATAGDAEALHARIQGELARQGDADARAWVDSQAHEATAPAAPPVGPVPATPPVPATAPAAPGSWGHASSDDDRCNDDTDAKMAALNALLQMDASRAMPILTKVLARRDAGSECLRRKAVFLVAQKSTDSTADVLLRAARTDPDGQVREQAVFWLSQVEGPRTVAALDSIARFSTDQDLQDKAVFALSQQNDPKAVVALKEIAERKGTSIDIREKAIFWLGQSHAGSDYLRGLYSRLDDESLKEKVIFAISQSGTAEDRKWLLDLARDPKSSTELRKQGIFWASQSGASAAELGNLYTSLTERELKEQAIFAMSQIDDSSVVDRLVQIARKDSDPEMRKKALFWLSQRDDPRVADLIEQMLSE